MDGREVEVSVSQSLFVRVGDDGHRWEFGARADGGCALVCDGVVIAVANGDQEGVSRLLQQFLQLSSGRLGDEQVNRVGEKAPAASESSTQAA